MYMKTNVKKLIEILKTQPQDQGLMELLSLLTLENQMNEVDLNKIISDTGLPLLVYCAKRNYYNTAELLLKNGAHPDGRDISAIHCATMNDNAKMIDLLVSYNANLNVLDLDRNTALYLAITHKRERALKYFMEKEVVDVNISCGPLYTPMMEAFKQNNITLLWNLIKKGGDFDQFKHSLLHQDDWMLESSLIGDIV
jgi:ankyrin repeat protein